MLTILIPSYNHEKYILECLGSAVDVDVIGKKIIVIDDGSVDATPELVKSFIAKNPKEDIKFIKKKNTGLVSSLNLGLSLVQTEFMYLVASDDVPVHRGIEFCVNQLIEDPDLKFVIGGADNLYWDGSLNSVYRESHLSFFDLNYEEKIKQVFINYPKPLLLQSTVFRTKAIREVEGWDKEIILDDYSIFIKLLIKYSSDTSNYLFNPGLCTVKYRQHDANSAKNYPRQYLMVKQVIDKYAPCNLKNKAIGYRLGFYMMLCLKNGGYRDLGKIVSASNARQLMWAAYIIPVYLYRFITRTL